MSITETKIDRSSVQIFTSFEEIEDEDRRYWQSKSPAERLAALELMRQAAYGYDDPTASRLQRVLEVVKYD